MTDKLNRKYLVAIARALAEAKDEKLKQILWNKFKNHEIH